jgi:hypothetical protein
MIITDVIPPTAMYIEALYRNVLEKTILDFVMMEK